MNSETSRRSLETFPSIPADDRAPHPNGSSLEFQPRRVDAAFDRFQLLLGEHFTPTASRASLPPPVHRPVAFHQSINGQAAPMAETPSRTTALQEGEKRRFLSQNAPDLMQLYSKRSRPSQLSSAPFSKRVCMKCWTGVGTLYCDQCTALLCAPCAVATHSKGSEVRHLIKPIKAEEEAPSQLTRDALERMKRKPPVTSKQDLAKDSNEKTALALINFRELPDPNYQLPPISTTALKTVSE